MLGAIGRRVQAARAFPLRGRHRKACSSSPIGQEKADRPCRLAAWADRSIDPAASVSLQSFLARLLPNEAHFYTYLEEQIAVVLTATTDFLKIQDEGADFDQIHTTMRAHEKEGDRLQDKMLDALGATFVTPIDREDIMRLSKRFDDILDLLDVAARSFLIFHVKAPTEACKLLLGLIFQSCQVLAGATPLLRSNRYDELIQQCRLLTGFEKEGDRIFREELSRIFADPNVDAKEILRERELLDRLETALDKCRSAAETMIDIAVKHA